MRFIRDAEHTLRSVFYARLPTRKTWRASAVLGLATLFFYAPLSAHATKISERSKQKHAAETQRADLQQKLSVLKRDIDRTEVAKTHAADALAHSEIAISQANRSLRELAEEQAQTEARLAQLSQAQINLARTIDTQQKQLSTLLKDHYVAGTQGRVNLLLSGDNPNRINRDLQYMGYVSQAQAALLTSLRANLKTVEANKEEAQNGKDALDEIAQEALEQKNLLQKEKTQHTALLSQLSTKLASQRKEAGSIQRDDQRLAGLVDKLAGLIEEQRKAEAAAQEKRRQEQLARAQKEHSKEHNKHATLEKNKSNNKINNPDAIDDDPAPTKSLGRNELTPDADVKEKYTVSLATLRGQLHLPVKGELIAKFGSKRGDAPAWKGLFIRAAEGTEVKSIAPGRVIFADWLRGFGNLIIVDHGDQYMTIYGNNQAVLKHAGDTIKTGDVIASVGNSGGNEHSGLYFEMRHQGRAFDPLDWVTFR